ncbi:MAG: hypothetical protein WDN09_01155 [bacterium]
MGQLTDKQKAFSTIELMIAMAIIVMVLSAVVMTSFGSQSFLIGSQTNAEGMKLAQGLVEEQQALARKDFNLVNSIASHIYTDASGFAWTEEVSVENPKNPSTDKYDYLAKEVTVKVSWQDQRKQERDVTLKTLVSNLDNSSSSATCNSSPSGNWTSPDMQSYSLSAIGAGINNPVTGLDAFQDTVGDKLYVTTATSGTVDNKFLIFDLADNGEPSYKNGIDTSLKGANALTVVSPATGEEKTYAFLANAATPTNWTCLESDDCSQFQVVDVSNPSSLSSPTNLKLNWISGSGSTGNGKSIYYRNGYVFLGLVTGGGPEFNVIDVHNPHAPQAVGKYSVGRTVNAIYANGNYAYLATDDNAGGNTLLVLDISNPTTPALKWPKAGSPIMGSTFGYGNAITAVANSLYFGMSNNSSNPEFYTLANPNPAVAAPTTSTPTVDLPSVSVKGIAIRDYLANILRSDNKLAIYNMTTSAEHDISLPSNGTALDCQGNYLYAGDAGGHITVVTGS